MMFVEWKGAYHKREHSSTVDRLMIDRIFKSQFNLAATRWNQLSCDLTSLYRENHSRSPMILLITLETRNLSLSSWTLTLAQSVSILHHPDESQHSRTNRESTRPICNSEYSKWDWLCLTTIAKWMIISRDAHQSVLLERRP